MNCLCHHFSKCSPYLFRILTLPQLGVIVMLNILLKPLLTSSHFFFVSLPPIVSMHFDFSLFFFADVKHELDDLSKTMRNFEARVGFTKDLETISAVCCNAIGRLTHHTLH